MSGRHLLLAGLSCCLLVLLFSGRGAGEEWSGELAEDVTLSDTTVTVSGNLTIQDGVTVVLRNSTLEFADGGAWLAVGESASLRLWDVECRNLTSIEVDGGSLFMSNITLPDAELQITSGSASLVASSFGTLVEENSDVNSGYWLNARFTTPFGTPINGGSWNFTSGDSSWSGSIGETGESGWIAILGEGAGTGPINLTGAVEEIHFGRWEGSLALETSQVLEAQLEVGLMVDGFQIVGSDSRLTDEPFELVVSVRNTGTAHLNVSATLSVVDTRSLSPLSGTGGEQLSTTEMLQIRYGESRTMSLPSSGIASPGSYLCYYRIFAEQVISSPVDGEAEILRSQVGSPFSADDALVLVSNDDGVTTIRAPHQGIQKELLISQIENVTAGQELILVELDFGSSSRKIDITSPPSEPEKFLGIEYRYWMFILPLSVLAGAYGRERYRLGSYRVEEVYLLDSIGRVIAHSGASDDSGIDQDIMGSMLQALSDFVSESFQADETRTLKKLEHGDLLLLIERGRNAVLALVVRGQERPEIREQLVGAIDLIENQFGSVLENWDGDLGRFEGAGEIIESLVVIRESVTWYVNPMAIIYSTRDRFVGFWHRFF